MTATQLNPSWLDADTYIEFLNRGFRGGWDRAAYDFFLARGFGGKETDIAVRVQGRTVLSGVSFCYRQLCVGEGPALEVCIMSAGTTLPGERGRGHYADLLRTGLDLCRMKSCAAVLGFVTRGNASGRGLLRLGAYSIPSFYIASNGERALPRRASRMSARVLDALAVERHAQALRGLEEVSSRDVRIHYPELQDWLRQFLRRPNPMRAVRLAHDAVAFVESVGDTDRLQWLGCPQGKSTACIAALIAQSAAAGRQFFMYTLDPLVAAAAKRLGLDLRGGRLMLLPLDQSAADWSQLVKAPWRLQSGDRM